MKQVRFILKYLLYLFKGKTKQYVHSPFVNQLIKDVIHDNRHFYSFDEIENLRKELLRNNQVINVKDFGAGSMINSSKKRTIKDLAKNSAKSAKYGQLLFRLVNHFQPKNILELGTSLGISTLYQSLPVKNSKFVTLEGCPETAKIAKQNFEKFKLKNIELIVGNFDDTLPLMLNSFSQLYYVFFDGNHQREPTLNYFEQCLKLSHNDSLFIFDDIHWSDEMEDAWKTIQQHPKVTVTIDLFFVGLVFFRKESPKQNFTIIF